MKKIIALFITLIIFVFIWAYFPWQNSLPSQQKTSKYNDVDTSFTLDSSKGKVKLSDFKDKVVLIYFGYTWCPDICPTNLALISAALSELNEHDAKQVQGIFISVDPDRDTPTRLEEFSQYFHDNIIGLTANKKTIDHIAKRYGVAYRLVKQEQESATGYVVDHSSETYVVNKQGKLADKLPHAAPPEEILRAIKENL